MHTADVVIIGGGIVGSSIAWHLTEGGCKNVLVLERESHQGKGSTGKSMGGVRAQFSTALNIRMSLYSIPFYAAFEEKLGHPSGYCPQGYLFLATRAEHMSYLRETNALQRSLGLDAAVLLDHDNIAARYPGLRCDDVIGGSFCASDGFVDPYSAMTGFMARASEQGATLWRSAEVTAIDRSSGEFVVRCSRGDIATRRVVNAAGAWAAPIAALGGIELPVQPLRRTLVPTEPFDGFPHSAPMIIDMSNGFHFRPEGRGFLLAWNDPEEVREYRFDVSPGFIENILELAAQRVPSFAEVPVNPKRAWSGLYEMTPDHYPIFGDTPAVPGFYLANGFSGHGVMHAPATGKIVSDLVLKGSTDFIDWRALDLARFREGRMIHEKAVL